MAYRSYKQHEVKNLRVGVEDTGSRFFRTPYHKILFTLLVVASCFVGIIDRVDSPLTLKLRMTLSDALSPVYRITSYLVESTQLFFSGVFDTVVRNKDTHAVALQRIQDLERKLLAANQENESLKQILKFPNIHPQDSVVLPIIHRSNPVSNHTFVLRGGKDMKLEVDQVVRTDVGLVGRLTAVGNQTSRALLLTDYNSRVPVLIESTGQRAILQGEGTALPTLQYLDSTEELTAGSRLITSGDGGVFPFGIPVGTIKSVGSEITVSLFAPLDQLRFVVLDTTKVDLP